MGFDLTDFYHRNRSRIIREWAKRLNTEVGEQYDRRPREELLGTVSDAFDADLRVLFYDDFSHINRFIDNITRMRLESGFQLSDVQRAFELFRSIVIPLLAKETTIDGFHEHITKINRCLAYTIHRFSDHFQEMHERQTRDYAHRLEEQVRARTRELKESELKYKTLVEEINDGYFVVQDEVIVFANQAFCKMHGYRLEEVMGKKFPVFIDPKSRGEVTEIYSKSLKRRPAPHTFEYLRLTRDGRSFPTEITAKITSYENRPSNIGICRDITERVKMEQKVRESERMAYIGQITTSLSHEIRNPLSAVKMNLQILKRNPEVQGNDQRRIDISVREVIRLERILKELLDFAKPLQMEFGHVQVNGILSSCAELLEMRLKEENLSITKVLETGIPDIQADGQKLEQAFINLLLNAIEASGRDGRIRLKSIHHTDGDFSGVEVAIEDEGHGVPEKHLPEIFKPFFTTKSRGTGLGLTNVKRIVEAHGGWLEVENIRPRGAAFRMYLPLYLK